MSHPSDAPNLGQSFDQNRTTLRASREFSSDQSEPSQDQAKFERAEHNLDHPEMTPGGSSYPAPTVNEIASEHLPSESRKAIENSQARFDEGRTEMGDPIAVDFDNMPDTNDHGWSKQSAAEYEKFASENEDNTGNTPESADEFEKRILDNMRGRDNDREPDDQDR